MYQLAAGQAPARSTGSRGRSDIVPFNQQVRAWACTSPCIEVIQPGSDVPVKSVEEGEGKQESGIEVMNRHVLWQRLCCVSRRMVDF